MGGRREPSGWSPWRLGLRTVFHSLQRPCWGALSVGCKMQVGSLTKCCEAVAVEGCTSLPCECVTGNGNLMSLTKQESLAAEPYFQPLLGIIYYVVWWLVFKQQSAVTKCLQPSHSLKGHKHGRMGTRRICQGECEWV